MILEAALRFDLFVDLMFNSMKYFVHLEFFFSSILRTSTWNWP